MSVIKLSPSYKDYLWGGNKLKESYRKETPLTPLAESWEISTHKDGPSYLVDYPGVAKTLPEYIAAQGRHVLGTKGQAFEYFPILVKFIDAKQDLSIQVHPEDAYAKVHENEYGKTEMWYILEAEPGASIYYGTKTSLSKEAYREAIETNTILDVLNKVPVSKGDVIFVEAGTIHAIGAGIVICEIQQNSNTTYRVYDFNRKDANGNLRELHIQQAIDVSNLEPKDTSFEAQEPFVVSDGYQSRILVSCDYFTTTEVILDDFKNYYLDDTSFEGIVVVDGYLTITQNDTVVELKKGESAFIDANTPNIKISGIARYLSIRV